MGNLSDPLLLLFEGLQGLGPRVARDLDDFVQSFLLQTGQGGRECLVERFADLSHVQLLLRLRLGEEPLLEVGRGALDWTATLGVRLAGLQLCVELLVEAPLVVVRPLEVVHAARDVQLARGIHLSQEPLGPCVVELRLADDLLPVLERDLRLLGPLRLRIGDRVLDDLLDLSDDPLLVVDLEVERIGRTSASPQVPA